MKVFVQALEFYAFHGVPAAEREVGHRYSVDLELVVADPATESDGLEGSVDYAAAAAVALRAGTEVQCRTVEFLAGRIGHALLDEFPQLVEVVVRVAKPFPPMPVVAGMAGVERTIQRSPKPSG